ncbi:hypothetical protein [Kineosporia sp. A_224]|uniref:hypothetical protein n=1 Tax=Kineosporia sp. A_224 TaxID=1962180 RepID=UPI000B4BB502|nr:hypothetical protein [Kineosporia sp. A_224]
MTDPAPGATGPDDATADPDEDDLPARDDPYWDDLTAETFAFLRRLRAAERRRKIGSAAYTAYVALVVALVYVVPYVWYALVQPVPVAAERTAPAWALAGVGLGMLVLVGFLRDGGWRGPAVVDRPTAAWLLPSPTHRRALLVPRWRTALALGAVSGVVVGGLLGIVGRVVSGGTAGEVAAAGAVAGLLLGAGGTALGGVAETARRPLRRAALLWLAPGVVLGGAVLLARAAGRTGTRDYLDAPVPGAAGSVAGLLLWSGPWGWVVQPLVAALPGRAPGGVETLWPGGLLLAVAATALLVRHVDGRVSTLDARTLRDRADAVALVGASILALQPRRARLTVLAAQGHAPSTRVRLPVPRQRWLVGPWRDATSLLRAPSRLVWSVLWLALGVVLLAASWRAGVGPLDPGVLPRTASRARLGEKVLLGVPGLVAVYLSAAQLAEPARLDADDVRRMRIRPTAATRQALGHAVVPVVVLGLLLAAGLVVIWALTGIAPWTATGTGWIVVEGAAGASVPPFDAAVVRTGLVAAFPALPVMVGAALVSAYRGDAPLTLLSSGAGSPMGDPGPASLLAWYARAPIVAVVLLVPTLLGWSVAGTVTAVGAVAMLTWAGIRAEAMLRA